MLKVVVNIQILYIFENLIREEQITIFYFLFDRI